MPSAVYAYYDCLACHNYNTLLNFSILFFFSCTPYLGHFTPVWPLACQRRAQTKLLTKSVCMVKVDLEPTG